MHRIGTDFEIEKLAKELGRPLTIVKTRIHNLNNSGHKVGKMTENESRIIIDTILKKRMVDSKLHDSKHLSVDDWKSLAVQMGRSRSVVENHWHQILQPWLLQYFSGTLNLPIKLPLLSFIKDNFGD